jgi:hypothetical protein
MMMTKPNTKSSTEDTATGVSSIDQTAAADNKKKTAGDAVADLERRLAELSTFGMNTVTSTPSSTEATSSTNSSSHVPSFALPAAPASVAVPPPSTKQPATNKNALLVSINLN